MKCTAQEWIQAGNVLPDGRRKKVVYGKMNMSDFLLYKYSSVAILFYPNEVPCVNVSSMTVLKTCMNDAAMNMGCVGCRSSLTSNQTVSNKQ